MLILQNSVVVAVLSQSKLSLSLTCSVKQSSLYKMFQGFFEGLG